MRWEPIPHLTSSANQLFAEEWAFLDWLAGHDASHADWLGVLDALIANGRRIDVLEERKYK